MKKQPLVSIGALIYHIIALVLLIMGVVHNNALFCLAGIASSVLGTMWQIAKVYTVERLGNRRL